jgi:hypothetical protein
MFLSTHLQDISAHSRRILMQKSVLEALLVVDYMAEISIRKFAKFCGKFGSKVEIC